MKKTNVTILLILSILLFVNLLSEEYFFRIDLTEDKQYTLSEATEDIMKSLENPITIKASRLIVNSSVGGAKAITALTISYKREVLMNQ